MSKFSDLRDLTDMLTEKAARVRLTLNAGKCKR